MTRSLLARFVSSSVVVAALIVGAGSETPAQQPKADKTFSAVVTDGQGLESDVKNIHFYWEERSAKLRSFRTNCGTFRSNAGPPR